MTPNVKSNRTKLKKLKGGSQAEKIPQSVLILSTQTDEGKVDSIKFELRM